eukprot:UN10696
MDIITTLNFKWLSMKYLQRKKRNLRKRKIFGGLKNHWMVSHCQVFLLKSYFPLQLKFILKLHKYSQKTVEPLFLVLHLYRTFL